MVMKTCRTQLPSTERENVEKVLTVDRYNTYTGGVDKSDKVTNFLQLLNHRTVKRFKRATIHPIYLAIVNVYSLYQLSTQSQMLMSPFQFRLKLANKYLPELMLMLVPLHLHHISL